MDSLHATVSFRDDLLDFPSDISDDDDDDVVLSSSSPKPRGFSLLPHAHTSPAFPEFVEEEELEWISNKDAFPMVESFVDIMPNHPTISDNNGLNSNSASHLSPVSVLENSGSASSGITSTNFNFDFGNFSSSNSNSRCHNGEGSGGRGVPAMISSTGIFKAPGKPRSKQLRRRRREVFGDQFRCWEKAKHTYRGGGKSSSGIGRKCVHCGAEKTPQWRTGPYGPKTLCNACGVRYKSGRLVPEYRPASSPTFSSVLHSNSHRKIVEMRKQKMVDGELVPVATLPHHVG